MKKINIILLFLLIIIILNFCLLFYNEKKGYYLSEKFSFSLNNYGEYYVRINDVYEDEGATYEYMNEIKDAKIIGFVDTKRIGKYIVKYKSDCNELNTYNLYRIVNVIDTEKPIINLKGDKVVKLYIGEKYIEPGFNVSDNSLEQLNDKVIIKGKVDTNKEGKYVIDYEVSDSSNNTTNVQRTVYVVKKNVIQVNTKVQTEKRTIAKAIASEKGSTNRKIINFNKYPNTITSMHFTNNGINLNGYVKNCNLDYVIKLCINNNCTDINIEKNKNNYSSNIDLRNVVNGKYDVFLSTSDDNSKIYDELSIEEKIQRAKIGDKLVTVIYNNDNTISLNVEDFKYEYDVLIDAGHGGIDPGAHNSFINEKNLNLTQSLYEKKRYEEHGLKVLMTRTNDSYGLQMGDESLSNLRRRAFAIGYYGVVSKIVYSNHHNSISDPNYSGYELILTNQGNKNNYSVEYSIANEWGKIYKLLDNHTRIYGRNYNTDVILSKENGQVYSIKNYYAVQRIPYELFNIYTVTYEGCYLSNNKDYEWYFQNWKKLSEIKIKKYVESLGIKYKEV